MTIHRNLDMLPNLLWLLPKKRRGPILLLANNFITSNKHTKKIPAGDRGEMETHENINWGLPEYLRSLNKIAAIYNPEIKEFDISEMDEVNLAAMINLNQIWMIVKGMPHTLPATARQHPINIHTVLNKVLCPLLLIPANWELKSVERLAYIADLRYCRLHIVRYLAEFARAWHASLSIAHMSARGLPDMAENYALSVFSEQVCPNMNYDQIFFNNIREKDLSKAVDVIINGMHNDILVMVNHRFHFNEIVVQ